LNFRFNEIRKDCPRNNVSGAPLNLLSYPGPISNDAVSLDFTLSTTSP
jgi:hypothetical protein